MTPTVRIYPRTVAQSAVDCFRKREALQFVKQERMASANAPYATLYNEPKYESRRQADLAPWEKEQWAWKKSKTCGSGGPNAGATPDLITPEPPALVVPAASPVPCAQSAPFATEQNMPNQADMPPDEVIAQNKRAPWEREESPYFSKVFLSSTTPPPSYLHTARWR